MRPCTLRFASAEKIIKATSLDDLLVEHAPWCRTAPAALPTRIKPLMSLRARLLTVVVSLTAIGLVLTLGGNAAVSNRVAEPNYDRMLAWDPDHMPANWEAVRHFYFRLNWIRAISTWTAFGLFLAALVDAL